MASPPLRRKPLREADLSTVTLLTRADVIRRLRISDWKLRQLLASAGFPKPIRLGSGSSEDRWRLSAVASWVDRIAATPHLPRQLRGRAARWHQPKIARIRLRDN